jgi:cation diffusion facilitator CzcD-associated flavoprotein CzcO
VADGHSDIVVVGTGFAGLGMAIRLRQEGIHDFVVLERADDVGGTWRENTYPGCQCDIPSHLYSFSFAPNPEWSQTYPLQFEIWDYLRDCANRFGVMPHIRFGHELRGARWDDEALRWRLETSRGPLTADVLIAGTGPLTVPSVPQLTGLDRFQGRAFHSAEWDHSHDLDGGRVASIGTGASAIQLVPQIQPRVERLHVFQRTAPWVLPHPNRRITELERGLYRRLPPAQRLVRTAVYWNFESRVLGMAGDQRLLKPLEALGRRHLRRQVPDPELRARLRPNFKLGCKRILISDDWYPALTAPNVDVVTNGIREVRERSIVTEDGTEREVDTIIFGTGFQVAEWGGASWISGRNGTQLSELWRDRGPQAYRGTTVAGFPNLFLIVGPNTGNGHNSLVFVIESQINYVLDTLREMRRRGLATVEVRPEAQAAWNQDIDARMPGTIWSSGCKSWYIHPSGRNHTLWPRSTVRFWHTLRRFDPAAYHLRPREVATGRAAAVA